VAPRNGEVVPVFGARPALDEIDEAVFGGPECSIGEVMEITAGGPMPIDGEESSVVDDGLSWRGLIEPPQKRHLAHEDVRRFLHGRARCEAASAVGNAGLLASVSLN
jgi:hypothetical protein